ncbi:MAG: glycosidase [Actinomycetota bacterium]
MTKRLPSGVMLNAYPDSVGERLADMIELLRRPELADVVSLFYVLPTFFNSDLDRGFSVVDYGMNDELVAQDDLDALADLGVELKLDFVLNHLSVASPQFRDLVELGDQSSYRDFFIDWNEFWAGHGEPDERGVVVPDAEHLERLFMRKPGLPVLRIPFPDGSDRWYWNTFYQQVTEEPVGARALTGVVPVGREFEVATVLADAAETATPLDEVDFGVGVDRSAVLAVVGRHRRYLGQMDLDARSEQVWTFYRETLERLAAYGARIVRLDAFAYLHKEIGRSNFFNRPGTWEQLRRLADMAAELDLTLLPEIHAEYGTAIHTELADEGFPVYDFFFPGLVIDAIDRGRSTDLKRWIDEVIRRDLETVTMLGCHDGIPVIDLRGGTTADGEERAGLLPDDVIESTVERLLRRGGRVKNLYGPDGQKISYYQVNATFYSALGEDDDSFALARALHLFVPGTPQVWYLDLFAGSNDVEAADRAGPGGHKEINRTNLSLDEIERRLSLPVVQLQLELLRLRNTSPAFQGELSVETPDEHEIVLEWTGDGATARLEADLAAATFLVSHLDGDGERRWSAADQGATSTS